MVTGAEIQQLSKIGEAVLSGFFSPGFEVEALFRHRLLSGTMTLFACVQSYMELCKKHPSFRERSENADLAVRPLKAS